MNWRYVRPDENWMRSASSLTATSAQTGYPATRVADNDPAWPWWAAAGTATLSIDLGAPREVGIIALIHNNGDDTRTITIGGDVSTTIAAARQVNAYPKNVAYIPAVPFTGQNFTIAIASNSINWAIGEVVIGKLRGLSYSLRIGAEIGRRRNVVPDIDEQFEHEIRHDLGAETWRASGVLYQADADFPDVMNWWESTKGGTLGTLIVPDDLTSEPRLVRMDANLASIRNGLAPDFNSLNMTFTEQARGILVI